MADDSAARLERAFDSFLETLGTTASELRADPAWSGGRGRAAGALYWVQMLLRTIEEDLQQDPDFPMFRVVDHRIREGADNPDQRYLMTLVRGGAEYRLWGRKRGERRLEVQLYSGMPWTAEGGRVAGVLVDEALECDPDGSFEIRLGGEEASTNWLPNPPDATMVMVRQIYGEWGDEVGEVHIDRVGFEGEAKPVLEADEAAERFEKAAASFREFATLWPRFGREKYRFAGENELTPPWDPGRGGGVVGRFMSIGAFELEEDEALILTTWPASGNYQGVQLTDLYTSSLEYANRQTSLTGDQSFASSDGAYRIVISHEDPGVQNWLDTTGLPSGYILLRFDGTHEDIPDTQRPRLEKLKFSEIRSRLPDETPSFGSDERRRALARRRRHVQRRFGV